MPDIFSECPDTHWCKSNCFYSSISIQGRNYDTIYHKFILVSKFDSINQKAAQFISQLVDSNTSTFMPNPVNMCPHFSTFCQQAGTLNIQHSWKMSFHFWTLQNNQILKSASLLLLWKQMLTLKGFWTSFGNLKQQLDAYALFFKVYCFLKKQKLHWTQHTVTLHSNACHKFDINNKRPCRFYSTATPMMRSVLTAEVVVGRVWQVTT